MHREYYCDGCTNKELNCKLGCSNYKLVPNYKNRGVFMITQKDKGIHCKGQGFNCPSCLYKNKCVESTENELNIRFENFKIGQELEVLTKSGARFKGTIHGLDKKFKWVGIIRKSDGQKYILDFSTTYQYNTITITDNSLKEGEGMEKPYLNITITLNDGEIIKTLTDKDLVQLTKEIEMNEFLVTKDKIIRTELIKLVSENAYIK